MIFKTLYNLGDKLEDKVRGLLSHYPIIYAFLGGAGIIIFWRGIWHTADFVMEYFFAARDMTSAENISHLLWWDGPLSILVGLILLLSGGLFVTSFIGNEIIISGLRGEKKTTEKTKEDVEMDLEEDMHTDREVYNISRRLDNIENLLKNLKR